MEISVLDLKSEVWVGSVYDRHNLPVGGPPAPDTSCKEQDHELSDVVLGVEGVRLRL